MQIPADVEATKVDSQDHRVRRIDPLRLRISLQIALTYFFLSLVWIVVTDGLVLLGIPGNWFWASTGKGLIFIILTTILIYWLCRRGFALLDNSNSLTRAVVETITDAVYVKDRDGKYVLFNEAAAKFVGKSVDEVLGQDATAVFDSPGAEQTIARDRQVMQEGRAVQYVQALSAADVSRFYFTTKCPYRDADGNVVGVVGVSRDITEQKLAEESVKQAQSDVEKSLAQLRAVMTSLADGVVIADASGNLIDWNSAALRMHGLRNLDDVRKNFTRLGDLFELSEPGGAVLSVSDWPISRLFRGEPVENCELVVRCKDSGQELFVSYSGTRVLDANGQLDLVVVAMHDVTTQKRAEEAFRTSERRFRELADAIPQIVWIADPAGALTHLNIKAFEYSGTLVDELKGWSWERLIHPDDLPKTLERWATILQTGESQALEFRIRRADGEYRWHLNRQFAARDSAGRIETWYGTSTDIEDVKRAEAAARRSAEMLRLVLDNIPQGVFWKDRDSRYLGCNQVVARARGLSSPEEAVGRLTCDSTWINPDESEVFVAKDREVMETGVAQYHIVEQMTRRDGRKVWLETNKVPIRDADGHVTGILGTWEDITDRRRAEDALRKSEEQLRLAIETVNLGFYDWDLQTNQVYFSPRWKSQIGYQPEEIVDSVEEFESRLHPDDREPLLKKLREYLANPWPNFTAEFRFRHKYGSYRWIQTLASLIVNESGQPIRMLGTHHDLTEQKRAAFELETARDRMAKTMESAPIAICSFALRADGRAYMPFASPQISNIYGLNPEEIADDYAPAFDRTVPEDRSKVMETIKASADTMTDWRCEFRVQHPQRGTIWVEGHSIPSRQSDGSLIWHGYVADITSRKLNEAALEENLRRLQISERRFRELADAIPQAVWTADVTGKLTHVNAVGVRYTGSSLEEQLESDGIQAIYPDDLPAIKEGWSEALRDGTPFDIEARIRRAGGEYRWLIIRAVPIRDSSGSIREWYGTSTDVEDLKRIEQALRERERFLSLVTRTARVGITVVNDRYEYLFANEAYGEMLGLNCDQIIGQPLSAVLPTGWPQIKPNLDRVFAGEQVDYEVSLPPIRGRATESAYRVVSRPRIDDSGQHTSVTVIMDITEMKQTKKVVSESEERYRRLIEVSPGAIFVHDSNE